MQFQWNHFTLCSLAVRIIDESFQHGEELSMMVLSFLDSQGKLERCISEWSTWLKTTAERREEDQWDAEDRPSTGLARMVSVLDCL